MLSRRQLLMGAVGLSAAGFAAGMGVKAGHEARRRSVVPPNATDHPGIACWPVVARAPVVQVFFDPTTEATARFISATSDAFFALRDKCTVVHRAHFSNDEGLQMANALACADVVGHYWDRYTRTEFEHSGYQQLLNDGACIEFVTSVARTAQQQGVASAAAAVYVNGELVPDIGLSPEDYREPEALSAKLLP